MPQIVIVDTTVLLNLLNVPQHNQDIGRVLEEFEAIKDDGGRFLLPLAVVYQAGDHIADLPKGNDRWRCAGILRDEVRRALMEEAPWALAQHAPWGLAQLAKERDKERDIEAWLAAFPDFANRGKGYGMSALSIVQAWEAACKRIPGQRVRIWSLNRRLQGYDRGP